MDKLTEGIDYFLGAEGKENMERAKEIIKAADKTLETAEFFVQSLRENLATAMTLINNAEITRDKMADGYEKGMELLKRFGFA